MGRMPGLESPGLVRSSPQEDRRHAPLTISLSPQQLERIQKAVETDAYASNSEVLREALGCGSGRRRSRSWRSRGCGRRMRRGSPACRRVTVRKRSRASASDSRPKRGSRHELPVPTEGRGRHRRDRALYRFRQPARCAAIDRDDPQHCRSIGDMPGIGAPRPEVAKGLRIVPAGSYFILYVEADGDAHILRVIHGARDQANWS